MGSPRDLGPHRLRGLIRRDERLAICAAIHRESQTRRLAKILLPGRAPVSIARRFAHQAHLLSALKQPGLTATFDSGVLRSGAAFVVTEPIEGTPADEWLGRVGPLGGRPAVAAALVAAVADLCAQLARLRIVHGDLRLANLRLLPVPGDPTRFAVELTESETAALRGVSDTRSDVHALGGLFFELLTGAPPCAGAPDLGALGPAVSIQMQRLIGRMLAASPDRRYQTMDEVVTAIELILGRHRSRLAELMCAPAASLVPAAAEHEISEDLTPLDPVFTGDAVENWIAGASTLVRRLGAAAREVTIRKLVALRPRPQARVAAPTILVAEDDDDTRQSLVELLQEHGYRVIAARHGLEAQEYLRTGQGAECMLMDLWMPEMDGWTLAQEMEQGRLPAVPTIVMTAAEPHWGYPSATVVRKPFDTRQLLSLVRTVSAQARTESEGSRESSQPPP
jgi:CheY-like chemotaxis protein